MVGILDYRKLLDSCLANSSNTLDKAKNNNQQLTACFATYGSCKYNLDIQRTALSNKQNTKLIAQQVALKSACAPDEDNKTSYFAVAFFVGLVVGVSRSGN